MATPEEIDEIERVQAEYRRLLARTWKIEPGSKILEIGCGQGDMTVALAEAVGPEGRVVALDAADRDYGAPQTLGEATDRIKKSELGPRIDFHFETDIVEEANRFKVDHFDYAVFAHSFFYFPSPARVEATLRAVRPLAKKLLIAEWDIRPRRPGQYAHLLAVLVQGQLEAFKATSEANIRTIFSLEQLKETFLNGGWRVIEETGVPTDGLQDADWEIAAVQHNSVEEARALNLPTRFIDFLRTEVALMEQASLKSGNQTLDAFALTLERI